MISEQVDYVDIPKDSSFEEMVGGLLDDRLSFSDLQEYLESPNVTLHKLFVNGEYIGFYSVEHGHFREAHAYILPEFRRHSISALRFIARETPGPILTSVYGTHMHVYKQLERMGFEYAYTLPDVYQKHGKVYDVLFLYKGVK